MSPLAIPVLVTLAVGAGLYATRRTNKVIGDLAEPGDEVVVSLDKFSTLKLPAIPLVPNLADVKNVGIKVLTTTAEAVEGPIAAVYPVGARVPLDPDTVKALGIQKVPRGSISSVVRNGTEVLKL